MNRVTTLRTWSLWAAYAIMVLGFAYAVWKLDSRMAAIEDDICFAIITDLQADLFDVTLDPETQETTRQAILDIQVECQD